MWTPKRVLLLALGLTVFVAAYTGYAEVLGGIDGLPSLPASLEPRDRSGFTPVTASLAGVTKRLEQAFGAGQPELKMPIQIESRTAVIASRDCVVEEEGRTVRLTPVSMALFGKPNAKGEQEINTIRAATAVLIFDQPISGLFDMAKRKVVKAELHGTGEPNDGDEEAAKRALRFRITEKSLAALQKAGVADSILAKLAPLRDRDLAPREAFVEELARSLGEDDSEPARQLIVRHAAICEPIVLCNNRRTPSKDDDLEIRIPIGPVYFDDEKHLIHTADVILMQDFQSKPETKVTASGLEVHLATSMNREKGDNGRPRTEGADNAVERIVLPADVDMHLYQDAGAGLVGLSGAPSKPPPGNVPAGAPQPRDHIWITTAGPFVYDVARDNARFDMPPKAELLAPEWVTVRRNPPTDPVAEDRSDTLECQHLELQFQRKSGAAPAEKGPAPAAGGAPGTALQLEWMHAWGTRVTLLSRSENVEAKGRDLFHHALTHTTVLKGEPAMLERRDPKIGPVGDWIIAPELELIEDKEEQTQHVTARGAGRIHMVDSTTGKQVRHARWEKQFESVREGALDLLTFTGHVALVEDELAAPEDVLNDEKLAACKSVLMADTLQIWLDPPPKTPAPAKPASAVKPAPVATTGPAALVSDARSGGRKPRRVEATGHVAARSAQMRILDRSDTATQRLSIFFKDVAASAVAAPPAAAKPAPPGAPGKPAPIVVPPAPSPAVAPEKPPRPIELSAAFITAHVLRDPTGKTELEHLETEGKVHVIQAPSGDDKGFDVKGEKLDVVRKPAGNHLKVTSDSANLAELHTDKLGIVGPEIEIDQGDNTVTVDGDGYMTMENTTDFQGNPLLKPELLTVHWTKLMRFEGSFAEFHGYIQAEQANSRLQCQMLQVYFDKPVSLSDQRNVPKKPGNGQEPARAKKLVCDRSVSVADEVYETRFRLTEPGLTALGEAGVPQAVRLHLIPLLGKVFETRDLLAGELAKLLTRAEREKYESAVVAHASFEPQPRRLASFKSLNCLELTVQNLERTMSAAGPGVVRIIQPGGLLDTAETQPRAKPTAKPEKQAEAAWKLTLVTFGRFGDGLGNNRDGGGRMDADNNTHTALFLDDVQVLHIPWSSDPLKLREDIKMADKISKLPPGGLYMECRQSLKIYSPDEASHTAPRPDTGGKHIMTGIGQVYVKSIDGKGQLFWGSAEVVHFDEAKDQLVFDGKDGLAEVYQIERRGDEPKRFKGKKITYWRKDGRVESDAVEIRGGTR